MAEDQVQDQAQQAADAAQEAKDAANEAAEAAEEAADAAQEGDNEKAEDKAEDAKEAAEEAADAAEKAEEAAEEVKEEVKVEAAPAEKPEPTGKFKDLITQIEGLSALELSELVKALEERFGVSAAAPVAVAGVAPVAAGAAADEEKANYNVILANGGSNKIAAIKAVREVRQDLGLKEAKDLVDGAPKPLKENVPTEEAKQIKEKMEAAGATIELQ